MFYTLTHCLSQVEPICLKSSENKHQTPKMFHCENCEFTLSRATWCHRNSLWNRKQLLRALESSNTHDIWHTRPCESAFQVCSSKHLLENGSTAPPAKFQTCSLMFNVWVWNLAVSCATSIYTTLNPTGSHFQASYFNKLLLGTWSDQQDLWWMKSKDLVMLNCEAF